jgi:hypothetical protein
VRGDNLIRLFREFVAKFELKLNQLKLAQIASACAKTFGSPEEAAAMYEALLEKRGRLGAEASLYLEMELAGIRLKQARLDDVKKVLATGKEAVDALSGTSETVVYSSFYHVAAEYVERGRCPRPAAACYEPSAFGCTCCDALPFCSHSSNPPQLTHPALSLSGTTSWSGRPSRFTSTPSTTWRTRRPRRCRSRPGAGSRWTWLWRL